MNNAQLNKIVIPVLDQPDLNQLIKSSKSFGKYNVSNSTSKRKYFIMGQTGYIYFTAKTYGTDGSWCNVWLGKAQKDTPGQWYPGIPLLIENFPGVVTKEANPKTWGVVNTYVDKGDVIAIDFSINDYISNISFCPCPGDTYNGWLDSLEALDSLDV